MRSHLYSILHRVDKCNATSEELNELISKNNVIITQLKNGINSNLIGGNGKVGESGEPGSADPEIQKQILEPVAEESFDDLLKRADAIIKGSNHDLQGIDKFLEEYTSKEEVEKRQETIDIAVLLGRFLNELSEMIKTVPQYGDLQKQIDDITTLLEGYSGPLIE